VINEKEDIIKQITCEIVSVQFDMRLYTVNIPFDDSTLNTIFTCSRHCLLYSLALNDPFSVEVPYK